MRFTLPMAPEAEDYVPLDHRQRAVDYLPSAGVAEFWPIPLTRCGEPAPKSLRRARMVWEEPTP